MQAIILSIGDELTLGQSVDTNSAFLSAQLAERGIPTLYHQTISDDINPIAEAILRASQAADLVLITGGLGPTEDDLTRQALALALNAPLELDPNALEQIQAYFASRGWNMIDRNRTQAFRPVGTTCLDNPAGTAPGIRAAFNRATLYAMPGVPREMKVMFDRHVLPDLPRQSGRTILAAKVNTFGLGESSVGEQLGDLMHRDRNPKVGTTVSEGIVAVRIRSEFPTFDEAQSQLHQTIQDVEQRLGHIVFGRDEQPLHRAVGQLLDDQQKSLVTAESCTGGLLAKFLTDAPGSSSHFLGGWVVYSNSLKTQSLGVPIDLIESYGAVSEQVAVAMAQCAIERSGANFSLALTGIAGPTGASPGKPVGTVWIALGIRTDTATKVTPHRFVFPGNRAMIRDRAAKTALNLLRLHLMGIKPSES